MKRKEIAVLARSRPIVTFLENFFKGKKMYKATFFREPGSFFNNMAEILPAAVVTENCFNGDICHRTTKIPTLTIIGGNIEKGVEAAIQNNVKSYIYKPYLESDLDHKLETMLLEKDMFTRMQTELKELTTVAELNELLSATLDPKLLLHQVVTKIAEVIPVTRCSVIRVDWLHRAAFVVASYEDPNIAGVRLSLRKYPEIVEALTSKKPVLIRNVLTDPVMKSVKDILGPLGIRSILVLPIFFHDKIIGTLFLRTSRAGHTFSESEIRLLTAISGASANALYNAFLFEQIEDEKIRLEKLAITDYLTGIYNVRYFYGRIIEEFSRSQRYGLPISCLMIDIDFFKKINDAYGHKTGDHVLREFAQLLKKHSRKSDVLARYGGEEFILLLPQTPLEGVVSEAERIRSIVEGHRFKSLKSRVGVTVSVGVSVSPCTEVKTHDDLISFADNALFAAKNRGRNQVAIYGK